MIYAMSDVHGCYDKYQRMLEKIKFSSKDTLYVLGDVLDRGPDGVKILRDMDARANVIPLLGNHEFTAAVCLPWLMETVTEQSLAALDESQIAALSEWLINGGGPTIKSLQQLSHEEREDILDCIREMALYAEVDAGGKSFVLLHAGLENYVPGKPLSSYQLTDFVLGRPGMERECFPGKFLVFGHTPVRLLRRQAGQPPSDKIFCRGNQIAIDCGCVFRGGCLGCLCLDTMEEFYV